MITQLDELTLDREELDEEEEPKKMASGLHSIISGRLSRYVGNYVADRKLGYVLDSSATYDFQDEQPNRQPDVSFVSLAKMPVPLDEILTFAPDLAVEVVSKNDRVYAIGAKVQQYQQAGVNLIWVVYPFSQKVEIYRLNTGLIGQAVGPDAELDGEDVLPGFKLAVRALFE